MQLKKRLTEIENQLAKIEERHVSVDLNKELYEKYSAKYRQEIEQVNREGN